MSDVAIFWDPKGVSLDQLGSKKYLRATDGDTPYVSISIRMLSIDTPEVHYPGNAKPSKQDDKLLQLAEWIKNPAARQASKAPINADLAEYLYPRLATGKAGTLQEEQGNKATEAFEALIEEKLTKPGSNTKRTVFLRAAEEHFDGYGRLLAYMAPNYTAQERETLSAHDRATFNLLMVENGWAATFPIFPSIPKHSDLVMLQKSGQTAFESDRGAWADPLTLTGYEFRSCVRLYEITKKLVQGKKLSASERYAWISRYCVDITTREIHYPQRYFQVKPYNRIFIWPDGVSDAVSKLNLVPAT